VVRGDREGQVCHLTWKSVTCCRARSCRAARLDGRGDLRKVERHGTLLVCLFKHGQRQRRQPIFDTALCSSKKASPKLGAVDTRASFWQDEVQLLGNHCLHELSHSQRIFHEGSGLMLLTSQHLASACLKCLTSVPWDDRCLQILVIDDIL